MFCHRTQLQLARNKTSEIRKPPEVREYEGPVRPKRTIPRSPPRAANDGSASALPLRVSGFAPAQIRQLPTRLCRGRMRSQGVRRIASRHGSVGSSSPSVGTALRRSPFGRAQRRTSGATSLPETPGAHCWLNRSRTWRKKGRQSKRQGQGRGRQGQRQQQASSQG